MVTITGVKLSPDLRHARVFFSALGDEAQRAQSLRGLSSAAGFIRTQVARRLNLRVAPRDRLRVRPQPGAGRTRGAPPEGNPPRDAANR